MVVLRIPLLLAAARGCQPIQICSEPVASAFPDGSIKHSTSLEDDRGLSDFDEMKRVDDSDAASGVDAMNGLSKLQVGIMRVAGSTNHARRCAAACSANALRFVRIQALARAGT